MTTLTLNKKNREAILQTNYCFPQTQPVTRKELNDYFHNLANHQGQKKNTAAIPQTNYCFPQEIPATKQELTQHIKNAERSGYSLTFEEHITDMEQWLKKI